MDEPITFDLLEKAKAAGQKPAVFLRGLKTLRRAGLLAYVKTQDDAGRTVIVLTELKTPTQASVLFDERRS